MYSAVERRCSFSHVYRPSSLSWTRNVLHKFYSIIYCSFFNWKLKWVTLSSHGSSRGLMQKQQTVWHIKSPPVPSSLPLQCVAWCWRLSDWWSLGGSWRPTPGWWNLSAGRMTSSGSFTGLLGCQEVRSALKTRTWWPNISLVLGSWWTPWVRTFSQLNQ